METFLIDDWMLRARPAADDANVVRIEDQASLTIARDLIRDIGARSGVAADVINRALLVGSEIGMNHLRHAKDGHIVVHPRSRLDEEETATIHRGLEIIGFDRGKGLTDVAAAADAPLAANPTATSLGVGVGSILRLSTDVDIDVRREEGTFLAARIFERGLVQARRHREVGIYGRPFRENPPSGDHASFHRLTFNETATGGSRVTADGAEALVIAICDGLGHGREAREASSSAVRVFDLACVRTGADPALDSTMSTIDEALKTTRGAVLTLAKVTTTGPQSVTMLSAVAVGNIEAQICSFRNARRLRGASGALGQPRPSTQALRMQKDLLAIDADEILILVTDGISTRFSIENDVSLLKMHPAVIAQRILEQSGRENDDALVVVVR